MRRWMEKWGAYALAVFCAGVILLSAVYTRQEDIRAFASENAAADTGETLAQAQEKAQWTRPVRGEALAGPAGARSENGWWRFDPCLYFAAARNQAVYAAQAGTVTRAGQGEITLAHADGYETKYKGLGTLRVRQGEQVEAGKRIADADDAGRVGVSLSQGGAYLDAAAFLIR